MWVWLENVANNHDVVFIFPFCWLEIPSILLNPSICTHLPPHLLGSIERISIVCAAAKDFHIWAHDALKSRVLCSKVAFYAHIGGWPFIHFHMDIHYTYTPPPTHYVWIPILGQITINHIHLYVYDYIYIHIVIIILYICYYV